MTIHSGHEQTIWEGQSQNVTAQVTGGRFTLRYRLTTHYLYFETGGITGTQNQQIPLINIQDVDVAQTLIQKSRKVGNVLVHIIRPNGMLERATLESVPDPAMVRDLINRTVHEVRAAAHQRQLAEQRDQNVHRFEMQGAPMPPVIPGVAAPMPPAPVTAASPPAAIPAAPQPMTPEQTMELLERLGKLRDAGVVTPEEFEAKKRELLARL